MPKDLTYILLLFALFVVPRALQRFRLPSAITSFLLGAAASASGILTQDPTLSLLATFGIVAMFLTAGLEVNGADLREGARVIAQHVAVRLLVILGSGVVIAMSMQFSYRIGALIALALFTPSTGFILDSLDSLGLQPRERFWIKSKAIATELLALGVLFIALQSTSRERLGVATAALLALVLVLPLLFRFFAARIAPYAPKSEFAFLLMLAVVSAYITRALGVYYLVGAFMVGIAAQAFRTRLPAMSSERTLHAVEAFASVFAPFYFFNAGLHLHAEDFTAKAIWFGLGAVVVCVPARIAMVVVHRRHAMGESWQSGLPIAIALAPTLVFSLVIAEILRDQFAVPDFVFGALIVYTVVNTILPGFLLGRGVPELDVLSEVGTPVASHGYAPLDPPVT
ncbi:MAG: cation:proton antiporter [Gemmatimonadaceae bacterium]|nr:cation:proton antiporter [Gemmatimonadaceae bacterium]